MGYKNTAYVPFMKIAVIFYNTKSTNKTSLHKTTGLSKLVLKCFSLNLYSRQTDGFFVLLEVGNRKSPLASLSERCFEFFGNKSLFLQVNIASYITASAAY